MKKNFFLAGGLSLALAILGIREFLLHQEISDLRSTIVSQLREHLSNATTVTRLRELQSSTVVFSRYLEPLFLSSSRMIWGPSRSEALIDWRRQIHTELEEQASKKAAELEETLKNEISELRNNEAPSVKRLSTALRKCEERAVTLSCSQLVDEELAAIQNNSSEKDKELLEQVKSEGIARLKSLQKTLASKSSKQISLYLTSGKYASDIEKPVLDLVLKIRQADLRRNAWNEFEKKRDQILGKKRVSVARAVEPRPDIAKRGIEKVTDPVTQALQLDSYFSKEDLDTPSDSGSSVNDSAESPSAADLEY